MSAPSFWTSLIPPGSMAVTLPLGPSTSTVLPPSLTVYLTPTGSGIGFLPIRDIRESLCWLASRGDNQLSPFHCSPAIFHALQLKLLQIRRRRQKPTHPLAYQTSQRISPPTPSRRACRPVITPFGVVMIEMPSPPCTRLISSRPRYTRHPGRDTRCRSRITASLFGPY